jgi:hypothetical protein
MCFADLACVARAEKLRQGQVSFSLLTLMRIIFELFFTQLDPQIVQAPARATIILPMMR